MTTPTEPAPLRIGPLVLDPPVVLAPMAGYTDAAMRVLCRRFGAAAACTEVANAEGLRRGERATLHLLETVPGERPVGAHIYGRDPDTMAAAAERIEALGRFDFIDLNCGCPVRKIVAKGCGVALMREPPRVEAIVRAMRGATALPVTVKMRLGLEAGAARAQEIADAAEQGGAAAVAVHARFASQRHAGGVDAEAVRRLCARGIPVIANGGIRSGGDAAALQRLTGAAGVMVGRGAIGNPWIFREIAGILAGCPVGPPAAAELRAVIEEHLAGLRRLMELECRWRRHARWSPERAAARHFRGHLLRYLAGYPGWAAVRRRMESMGSAADIMDAVAEVLEGGGGRDR